MIRIDHQCGAMRIDRIGLDERYGDGCYLTLFYAGQPPSAGHISVPLDREQALELADDLDDMSQRLGPGMVDRHRNGTTFSYRRHR